MLWRLPPPFPSDASGFSPSGPAAAPLPLCALPHAAPAPDLGPPAAPTHFNDTVAAAFAFLVSVAFAATAADFADAEAADAASAAATTAAQLLHWQFQRYQSKLCMR